MLGFVAVLASALLGIVLIFVTLLVSFIQAQLAPTAGKYQLENDSGLLFPIESYLLTDEIINKTIDRYIERRGNHDISLGTTCRYGERLDKFTAERYTAYNFVYLTKFEDAEEHIKHSKATAPTKTHESSRCYILITKYDPSDTDSAIIKFKH
ncbi:hypothetical protein [Vibrio sp. D431a]|uniref:hypothetical protein n=1 Tax=Vibrio sp. D431a TaxID=2837388 RepID=UPI00255273A9|nr:hypothetical protein [Vibrio sp. D431a]MDK9790735.1 hypothetical protein [Vibrio sp. D431a]